MKSFTLYDSRNGFRQDISSAMLMESYPFKLTMVKNFEEFAVACGNNPDTIPVISDTAIDDFDAARMSAKPVFGYASASDGIRILQERGVTCIGLLKTSARLLDALSSPSLPIMSIGRDNGAITSPRQPPHSQEAQKSTIPSATQEQTSATTVTPESPISPAFPTIPGLTPDQMMQMFTMFQSMQAGGASLSPAQSSQGIKPTQDTTVASNATPAVTDASIGAQAVPEPAEVREVFEQSKAKSADAEIDNDLLLRQVEQKRTRVISVYAAKGGVGKTSIAAELATCLALTSNGRRKFRVCIVDYNIDFGDIASTLDLDEKGPNMTYWAEVIRASIAAGESPDTISFTQQEMEKYYLQRVDSRFDAYALSAPVMHEDSMYIKSAELEVMLRNIAENGGFDYVICDTGNNTRDASVIAMERADYILLVVTQDVTTANCNASVLRTLRDTGFDTNKVRLVINNVMPARETGISVQEVEETFAYQCVCRIKRTPDIIRANNTGAPLVLHQPKHDYTKQIRRIVSFVTTGEVVHDEPKKSLFGRSKKR